MKPLSRSFSGDVAVDRRLPTGRSRIEPQTVVLLSPTGSDHHSVYKKMSSSSSSDASTPKPHKHTSTIRGQKRQTGAMDSHRPCSWSYALLPCLHHLRCLHILHVSHADPGLELGHGSSAPSPLIRTSVLPAGGGQSRASDTRSGPGPMMCCDDSGRVSSIVALIRGGSGDPH